MFSAGKVSGTFTNLGSPLLASLLNTCVVNYEVKLFISYLLSVKPLISYLFPLTFLRGVYFTWVKYARKSQSQNQ